ncbi:hypothetical protein BEP19_15475 [Ammoniphilus oxalaticus]|uniref:DUF5316 domain-containing protein n=1 Tax=Ammoniphilus oxalaticus TaxID=66863 RepID=A0A419SDB4_9BACL|nr:DUF5316 domain-containing protein [Ammoniphilus oxalaticus]RKD21076.1 hypothetical protein BEP19_15475 [Ammoniphilus oxalaticus]
MKSIGIGLSILLCTSIASFLLQDWGIIYRIGGGVGGLFLFAAGLLSGAFISGDRNRANFSNESNEETRRRHALFRKLFLIGIPNLVVAIIVYILL